MFYDETLRLKDGQLLRLRSAQAEDAEAVCNLFALTHRQTDFLLAYSDENSFTVQQEADFLSGLLDSPREVMLLAEVDGTLSGCASVCAVGSKYKIRHRAELGISVDQSFWGLGIGWALTEAAIQCARNARYAYLELSVVADNDRAIQLYRRAGFCEFGIHPAGFRSRTSGYQKLMLMGLALQEHPSSF